MPFPYAVFTKRRPGKVSGERRTFYHKTIQFVSKLNKRVKELRRSFGNGTEKKRGKL